jgi:hypothetical protein
MAVIEIAKIQVRRGQEGVTGVPQLDPGEFGWAQDTQHLYIGKSISEGAGSNENSRILTDKDLDNIFDLLGVGLTGSAASTSTYRYRAELPFGDGISSGFASTTTTIAKKLDSFVSLGDFTQSPIDGDITVLLQRAIDSLYLNDDFGSETVRSLGLPAGEFIISGVIDLPPFATLVGEGTGITTLVLNSAGQNMFRTVDGFGVHYEIGMQYNSKVSQNVRLSNMTLAYASNSSNDAALVSLDNTKNPLIENIRFTTKNANLSTAVNTGTAVAIRSNIGEDESTAVSIETLIDNCQFDSMSCAVQTEGLVSRPVFEHNLFTNLQYGIQFTSTSTTTQIVSNPLVSKNKFLFITNQAIRTSENSHRTGVISSDNTYYNIGNGSAIPDEGVTYQSEPVLKFETEGNVSLNDYFNRKEVPMSGAFYFNALVNKNAKIVDNRTRSAVVLPNNIVPLMSIPLTDTDQLVVIDYSLYNENMSRKGKLTVNISPDGYASVGDYYNYSENVAGESRSLVFSTDLSKSPYDAGVGTKNYVSITCLNTSTACMFEYTVDITV